MSTEEAFIRALIVCAVTAIFWKLFVVNGTMTLERLFIECAIGVSIGFAINVLIFLYSPKGIQ